MSIETSSPGSTSSVGEKASPVGDAAAGAGKDVAREAANQASAVVGEAKDQVRSIVDQTKHEVRSQLDARGQQAATGLQTISNQLSALTNGRPEEAGKVGELASDAQRRLQTYSRELQERGPQALADDVASFARRRPMVFLFGAAMAGFAAGRLVRAGAAASHEQSSSNGRGGNYSGPSFTGESASVTVITATPVSSATWSTTDGSSGFESGYSTMPGERDE